jgi:hypothetical protein
MDYNTPDWSCNCLRRRARFRTPNGGPRLICEGSRAGAEVEREVDFGERCSIQLAESIEPLHWHIQRHRRTKPKAIAKPTRANVAGSGTLVPADRRFE